MKHFLFFNIAFIFVCNQQTVAQNFQWAKKMGSPYTQSWSLPASDKGTSISIDNNDNLIIGGIFKETSDFDPGANTFNLTSAGNHDIFISKLDATGNFLWAVSFGGSDAEFGPSVTTDANNNIYCIGNFKGTVDFDPSQNTAELISDFNSDIFVLKLSPNGDFVWVKQIAAISSEFEKTIAIDPWGNVCFIGSYGGTVDFNPSASTFEMTSAGAAPFPSSNTLDVFVCKLDNDGNFLWAKSFGGVADDEGTSITVDNSGNIYMAGYLLDVADFDPSGAVFELSADGYRSPFICKLSPTGNLVWAKNFNSQGSSATATPSSITLDAFGNIYTTGVFFGIIDFDPGVGVLSLSPAGTNGSSDVFVSKLNPSGNLVWTKQLGGVDLEAGYSILVDALGDVFTIGSYQGTADFNPGTAVSNLSSVGGSHDMFISKLNSSGNYVWAKSIGGNSASKDIAWAMSFNSTGNICMTGQFYETVDFNPAGGIYNLTSSGSSDIFVLLLDGFMVTGIDDMESTFAFQISPNPSEGILTITSTEGGSLRIFSILGEVVYQKLIDAGVANIDLGQQTSGIYVYTYLGESGLSSSGKIVVR